MRFVVFCLLVVDGEIITFEPYHPVVGIIWRKVMSDIGFVSSCKSFVTCLNRYIPVSYKYIEGSKVEVQII
jgi:hypothetical protein